MKVDGRYTARPIEFYHNLNTWGEANDAWIEVGLELGEKALCRALVCRRSPAARSERDLCNFGHRHRRAFAGRTTDQSAGTVAEYQAYSRSSALVAWRAPRASPALPITSALSRPGGRALIRRALLPHAPARRSFHGAHDLRLAVRRRRCGDGRRGIGRRIGRPGNSRHQVRVSTPTPSA